MTGSALSSESDPFSPPDSAGNFRQVRNSDQALTGERERLVGALVLRHAENPMLACVVNGDHALIIDHQPVAIGEDSVSQIVLCADSPACPFQSATNLEIRKLNGS
jgi:hypothetical protein